MFRRMPGEFQTELENLGLLQSEAQIYLALIRNGNLAASALASVTGIPRSSVYPTLNALVDKGLVETGAGYGSRFSAIPPEQALPSLIAREKEEILQREELAGQLVKQLSLAAAPVETGPEEFIQVIRSPRGVAERFERLELEAEERIEVFVKPPAFVRPGNPLQEKAGKRGVLLRGLYERAAVEAPDVKPYLAKWISVGEEVRIHEGELPHKLAIFDRHSVLVHLTMPGDQMRTLFIRHTELATSLGMLFDSLWMDATPLQPEGGRKATSPPKDLAGQGNRRTSKGKQQLQKPGGDGDTLSKPRRRT